MTNPKLANMPARLLRTEVDQHFDLLGDFLVKQSDTSFDLYLVRHNTDYLSKFPGKTRKSELSVSVMGARVVAKDVAELALSDYAKEYYSMYQKELEGGEVVPLRDAIINEFKELYAFKRLYDYHMQVLERRYS